MKKLFFVAVLALPYLTLAALPADTFWYVPGAVRFDNAEFGQAPKVNFFREIKIDAGISYAAVTRDANNETACEGRGGPFTYKHQKGPLIDKDLLWWSAGDQRCATLPIGTYWTETCWTVVAPARDLLPGEALKAVLGWLLPPKHICRVSPPFEITAARNEGKTP